MTVDEFADIIEEKVKKRIKSIPELKNTEVYSFKLPCRGLIANFKIDGKENASFNLSKLYKNLDILGISEAENFINNTVENIVDEIIEKFHKEKTKEDIIKETLIDMEVRDDLLNNREVVGIVNQNSYIGGLKYLAMKEVADMRIIYYEDCHKFGFPVADTTMRKAELEEYQIKPQEIHSHAIYNASKRYHAYIIPQKQEHCKLYKIMSDNPDFGAEVILYPGMLDKIANAANDNYFLIPYNITAFYAIPENSLHAENRQDAVVVLKHFLQQSNENLRRKGCADDVLSDHIYFYDRSKSRLSIAESDVEIRF